MKMSTLDRTTRRKLIKIIREIGESYYVFTDGSNFEYAARHLHELDSCSKEQLLMIAKVIIGRAYRGKEHTAFTVDVLVAFAKHGVTPPYSWELPTETVLRMWENWNRIPAFDFRVDYFGSK